MRWSDFTQLSHKSPKPDDDEPGAQEEDDTESSSGKLLPRRHPCDAVYFTEIGAGLTDFT
jgi:hypothetical protein